MDMSVTGHVEVALQHTAACAHALPLAGISGLLCYRRGFLDGNWLPYRCSRTFDLSFGW